jgi:hypothetical protein
MTYPLDVQLPELLSTHSLSRGESEQSVFDIAMAPVDSLNFTDGGNVASTEGSSRTSQQQQADSAEEEDLTMSAGHDRI